MKTPKDLPGFEDFCNKIGDMGLQHLIVKHCKTIKTKNQKAANSSVNWWFLD
jgi:hypothetical protein